MARSRDLRLRHAGLVVAAALLVGSSVASAESNYSDRPFGTRMAAAFIRFTEVSAMGGETVANRWSSAINPASAGWTPARGKLGLALAPYYSNICLDEGTMISVNGQVASWDTRAAGTFQAGLSQIRSNRAHTKQGTIFDYEVDTALLIWGKRFDKVGVGGTFSISRAEVIMDTAMFRASQSQAENYRFRGGGLWEPAEKWLVGMALEYGFSPSRANITVPVPGVGFVTTRREEILHQFILRPGVSYEYADMSTVFLDYEYGAFWDPDGCLQESRFVGGIEYRVLAWMFLRAGGYMDMRGNYGYSAGIGTHFAEWIGIDFGYKYYWFPELRPEFGRSHTLQITLSVRL